MLPVTLSAVPCMQATQKLQAPHSPACVSRQLLQGVTTICPAACHSNSAAVPSSRPALLSLFKAATHAQGLDVSGSEHSLSATPANGSL